MSEKNTEYMVAIVEDTDKEADLLQEYFSRYAKEQKGSFHITRFSSGDDFLINYRPIYDLVLLDIGLPGHNGMEVAARLRETDQSVTLIFVTSMAQFAAQGYEVDAVDFIVKPVNYGNFALKLKRTLSRLQIRRDSEVVISQGENLYRVSASQIRYIEISSHSLIYHTADGSIEAYGSLKKVEEQLSSQMFARCNSCYLVNLEYVQSIQDDYVVLVGGAMLKMSRLKHKPFVQALNNYLGGMA